MTSPSVLVIGAGSVGSRHARNLVKAGATVSLTDPDSTRAEALRDHGVRSVPFVLEGLGPYDGVVVASPTVHHVEHARWALRVAARVLVEKPLALTAMDAESLVAEAGQRLMVGFNLRLYEPVRRLVERVHDGEAGHMSSVRLWFGSWLPDWRPSVDYRSTYSARADLGGGVLLDAVHELDLLVWLLGDDDFEVVGAIVERMGPLDIDVEDTVKALLRHSSGVATEVSLDYLSRRYRRGIEVIGDRATLRLDWARQVLEFEDGDGVDVEPVTHSLDLAYEREAECFVRFLLEGESPPVDGPTGVRSLRLVDAIRAAAL